MKKIRALALLLLALALSFITSCNSDGEKGLEGEEKDGLVYALTGDGTSYELIGAKELREEYSLAAEINGLPVVSIGNSAFYENTTVKKVNVPSGITKIGAYAFEGCTALESIVLPDTVDTISFKSFSGCLALREFRFPAALSRIGASAFYECRGLERLYVNGALQSVGKDAFLNCYSLTEFYIRDLRSWCSVVFDNAYSNPISLCEKAFVNGSLTVDFLIENVEKINDGAFSGFAGISSLTLGEGVLQIGEAAFANCANLKELKLSDSVTEIGKSAFNSCTSLQSIYVGRGVKKFQALAFYSCKNIENVEVSDLKVWCTAFFYTDNSGSANPLRYAKNLVVDGKVVDELVIPDGVKTITTLSFIGFRGSRVSLPDSLVKIENTAFYMCDNLTSAHYRGSAADLMILIQSIGYNNFANIKGFSADKR